MEIGKKKVNELISIYKINFKKTRVNYPLKNYTHAD